MSTSLLNSITHTQAAGKARANINYFNDVVEVGNFPVEQKINRISKIEVWGADRVIGLRFTYEIEGGGQANPLHGRNDGSPTVIDLTADQIIVGAFGRRDTEGNVGSLSFVIFEVKNGRVTLQTTTPTPPQAGAAYGTFGRIIAISGTKESAFGLCSLSFIKTDVPNAHLLS